MIEQKFWEGHNIVVKNRTFKIISVSKIFKDGNHINYFIVGQNKKSYVSFCQISGKEDPFKIVTEGKMYSGIHVDLPKKKIKKGSLF